MLPQSYKCFNGLRLNNSLQVWFTGNQRDKVPPFRYINPYDELSILFRV